VRWSFITFTTITSTTITTIVTTECCTYKASDIDVCLEHVADVVCTDVVDAVSLQSKSLHPVVVLKNDNNIIINDIFDVYCFLEKLHNYGKLNINTTI